MIRVLHVNDRAVRGGAETFVWQLANAQARTGKTEPYIATSEGVKSIRVWSTSALGGELGSRLWHGFWRITRTSFDPLSYISMRQIIRKISPDVAHFHNIKLLSPSILKAAYVEKLPIVLTLHDYFWLCPKSDFLFEGKHVCHDVAWNGCISNCKLGRLESLLKPIVSSRIKLDMLGRRTTLKKSKAIIVVQTEIMHEAFVERGYDPGQIRLIPIGVDTELFKPTEEPKEKYVLYVGRMLKEKGIRDFLTLAKMYKKRHKHELEFRVIGEIIKSKYVSSIGWISQKELSAHYSKALGFVFLARVPQGSGLGLVSLEAMASGTTVIAYSIPGAREIISDGYDGFLVQKGNFESVLEKIMLLHNNTNKAEEIGRRARNKIEQHFSSKRMTNDYTSLYESLV
jgi:glycosyltransferase involved in cell wall biosynthesis